MRIIGIKLFESRWQTVNKVLQPDWYPFGCYPEPIDGEPYFLPQRSSIEKSLYDIHEKMPHVEVSCIVGRNGSGKSTLLDILYRLINNFSFVALGCNGDQKDKPLEYADGLNADLYYEVDNVVYRIRCRDKEIRFYILNARGSFDENKLEKDSAILFEKFFYTISNNYSLYSLNENEYIEKRDEHGYESVLQGDWIPHLFHQQNGYQTPIVITPSRNKGSIDVENENYLAKQRIITMGFLSVATGSLSLIDGYTVRAIKYKLNPFHSHTKDRYSSEFKKCFSNDDLTQVLEDFKSAWEAKIGKDKLNDSEDHEIRHVSPLGIVPTNTSLDHLDSDYISYYDIRYDIPWGLGSTNIILDYLAYKSLKICTTYDEYIKFFDTDSFLKLYEGRRSLISGVRPNHSSYWGKILAVVDRLCDPAHDSHINLKIRQCINFFNSGLYKKNEDEIEISDILRGKEVRTLNDAAALLLPPVFDVDLVLEKKETSERISVSGMSSGERQMLYSLSYVMYHLMNIQTVGRYGNFNLIFDEAELYYHPDYQRKFIKVLIDYIAKCNLDKERIKSINIIIATHSPFVLSDILTSNTLYLSEGHRKIVERQSFGANFYDMLQDSFFFEDTAIGELASYTIDKWIRGMNQFDGDFKLDTETIQSLIGDSLIVNYLLSRLSFSHVQNQTRRD